MDAWSLEVLGLEAVGVIVLALSLWSIWVAVRVLLSGRGSWPGA